MLADVVTVGKIHTSILLQEKGAEFLDLLCAVVKVEDLDLPLKRNQGYVMKAVMTHYNDVAYIMSKTTDKR